MKVEYKLEISDLNDLVLLEINERVNKYWDDLIKENKFYDGEIEIMKIDKTTLENINFAPIPEILIENLIAKLDYLIKFASK